MSTRFVPPQLRPVGLLLASLAFVSGVAAGASPTPGPEGVVQAQIDAYNARDIDAFLASYAEGAQLFEHPAKLLASGLAQFRERYAERFKDPKLHAVILKRIVMGNVVVDHERVTRTFPEGVGTQDAVAIYEVQAGKITKGWLIPGPRTLDTKP